MKTDYNYYTIARMKQEMAELVKDPNYIKHMLSCFIDKLEDCNRGMKRAEMTLRRHGHKDAHRPITYVMLDGLEMDIDMMQLMVKALEEIK